MLFGSVIYFGGVIAAILPRYPQKNKVEDVNRKVETVKNAINSCFAFDEEEMTSEDRKMMNFGISMAIIDTTYPRLNIFNPLTYFYNNLTMKTLLMGISGISEAEANNNYYYIKAKTGTEYCIMIAARIAETGSLAAAITALTDAGVSFTGGVATFAGSGGLGAPIAIAIEVEATASLAVGGVLSIASNAFGKIADNAESSFKNDFNKEKELADKAVTDTETAIVGITDEEAIASGITDVTEVEASAMGRPSWRESEKAFAPDYSEASGYREQVCFKKDSNGNVVNANWGESGSIRIDFYKSNHIVEIKNYKITTTSGRSNLINNIRQQYWQRKSFFPSTRQTYCLDVRGQNVTDEILTELLNSIYNETETLINIIIKR